MSNRVYVNKWLDFNSASLHRPNIKGNPSTERMCSVDWFDGRAIDTTYAYTSTIVDDGTCALTAGGVHGVTLTTGATDNDMDFLATGLIFDITQKPEIESRIKIADVSAAAVFFGFSDATSETSPAATIDADSGTLTAVATDAVGFVIDADLGTSTIYCASVKTGGTVQYINTGILWADNQTKNLRVALDASGNANFYINGTQEGRILLAVADVPLCAIWNDGTRANGGATAVYARYLKKWQDVP